MDRSEFLNSCYYGMLQSVSVMSIYRLVGLSGLNMSSAPRLASSLLAHTLCSAAHRVFIGHEPEGWKWWANCFGTLAARALDVLAVVPPEYAPNYFKRARSWLQRSSEAHPSLAALQKFWNSSLTENLCWCVPSPESLPFLATALVFLFYFILFYFLEEDIT